MCTNHRVFDRFHVCRPLARLGIALILILATGCVGGRTTPAAGLDEPNGPQHGGSSQGAAATDLMTPSPPSSPAVSQNTTVGLVIGSTPIVRTPDWRRRSVRRAILYDAGEDVETPALHAVGWDVLLLTGGGNIYVFFLSAPVGALHLVYLPFGYTVGKIVGSSTEKNMRPCMEAFAERAKRLDVTEAFRAAAHQWGQTHGGREVGTVNAVGGFEKKVPDLVLDFDSLLVRLRECGSVSSFCVELSSNVKVSLKGEQTQYNSYVYSYQGRKSSNRGYEILLDQKSTSRDIEEYCERADGIDTLMGEVEKGIRAVTETALGDALGVPKPAVEETPAPDAK